MSKFLFLMFFKNHKSEANFSLENQFCKIIFHLRRFWMSSSHFVRFWIQYILSESETFFLLRQTFEWFFRLVRFWIRKLSTFLKLTSNRGPIQAPFTNVCSMPLWISHSSQGFPQLENCIAHRSEDLFCNHVRKVFFDFFMVSRFFLCKYMNQT